MIYYGSNCVENIVMCNEDSNELHYISLAMSLDEPKFFITCCCNEEWIWEFHYTSRSDYERIKMCIIDASYECNNMYELMDLLDGVFLEIFEDMIVIKEYERCNNCLN